MACRSASTIDTPSAEDRRPEHQYCPQHPTFGIERRTQSRWTAELHRLRCLATPTLAGKPFAASYPGINVATGNAPAVALCLP
jgi:hypothetical protein